ncbi:hypothetical protein BD309DRAFT_970426 [Dichomitus squalens]|uniref:Uncharacterized protein n=2 Tax=Dichomitus squalens TaxID=114155 RepID=A0A4V6MW86_9APHY|nr:uncharacterized protein DICSQDRAFT_90034 [Dichomitus squalens LYAD-421 SS1]EJF58913.1 hypothetical protein DICSQDRAFT_90034 [Dichomitus squalens LYAD-421 SS1]TBU39103.1 hypothetical protein BD309DRAFT_970426 [Dichomitus squalens]TBU53888.1 hypothetical protein BD310DRAFT_937072 [Dichomitus squalens]
MADEQDVLQEPKLAPVSTDASEPEPAGKNELWVNPAPPLPRTSYRPENALDDIPAISYALHVFLRSHMVESEEFCKEYDPRMERLYVATGFGLIQCVKGLMSFEDEDLVDAIAKVRHGNGIASQHRKRAASLPTRLAGLVVGSLNTSGVGFIKSMTPVERHAELVYAESLFEKALLGIVYSGDWLAFIKEALNMRTTISIYRQLGKYIEAMDAEAQAKGKGPEDISIDADFRSGVYLGVGLSNLILSVMPSRLLTIVELFGYKGDRHAGLAYLQRAGGWTAESDEPSVGLAQEGVRRAICDMSLLIFHLVLSSLTFEGVDIRMAQKILDYHIKRYPNGVFFLFGQGRLHLVRSQPAVALEYYRKALQAQEQYRNLHHISFWEMAITNLALWDVSASLEHWRTLAAEASWSKSTYTYGVAVCLLQIGGEKHTEEISNLMERVPALRKRIAGKSIPLEKFVARKARKFQQQGGRLALSALEFAYLFLGIAHAPRNVLQKRMLPLVDEQLTEVEKHAADPGQYGSGNGAGADEFWDDKCLANFLRAICLRYIAYPDPDAVLDGADDRDILEKRAGAEKDAKSAFEQIFRDGPKIVYDHYLVYHAHFEYARLLACQGDKEGARVHLEMVLSGKPLEVAPGSRKGKFSMENQLHVRAHAAMEAIDRGKRL